ncbi:glycosyltransferase [Humibacter ginsenosidimutans]|uniref:Glycosyltransferase n=1 Tax=Humibacter ginsenosidimutans TaxID=2599293 RepID=A0A5B8M8R4_9MICO|nr:glycosyltransferase [Humibacter ginsenosidimutans]QDZ16444.1 glycosyltransferase [Humibacter ginsenosidimutans]
MQERAAFGTIAMAAYNPDPELFARQLRSIAAQTHTDFECLISADGSPDRVAESVALAVPGDDRFTVIGFDDRCGFYGNFERVVAASDPRASWIALSDQDDYWYPNKLETLLPHLENHSLVSGQARVVEYPSGRVITPNTERMDLSAAHFTLTNQFTGGICVMRRDLIDIALPFPRLATPSEVHDHWLAVCASAASGTVVTQDVVQDYVQHGGNAIGEMLSESSAVNPASSWATVRSIADRYEGGHGPAAVARAVFKVSVGWRQLMVETLARRVPPSADVELLLELYGRKRGFAHTFAFIRDARKRGLVAGRSVVEYLGGWVAGWFVRGRSIAVPASTNAP